MMSSFFGVLMMMPFIDGSKPRRHSHFRVKLEPRLCTLMHLYLVKAMELRN